MEQTLYIIQKNFMNYGWVNDSDTALSEEDAKAVVNIWNRLIKYTGTKYRMIAVNNNI